ncbi:hypothetical protein D9M72_436880 [compost metagenome]
MGIGFAGVRVDVQGCGILFGGPGPVVVGFVEAHEVGDDGQVRSVAAQDVPLGLVVLQHAVGREPVVVQPPGGIGPGPGLGRCAHLIPVRIDLAPDVGTPRLVEFLQRGILRLQPCAEGLVRPGAVGDGSILVAHMPHHQGGVLGVVLPHPLRDGQGLFAVDGVGDIEVLP